MVIESKIAKMCLLLSVVILAGLALFVIYTEWNGSNDEVIASQQTVESPMTPMPEPTSADETSQEEPTSEPHLSGVYITPTSLEAKTGQEISINVKAGLTDVGISGSEIKLQFDPTIFQATALTPGGLLGSNPIVGTEEIDNQVGYVRYAIARKGKTQISDSVGVLATIRLTVVNSGNIGIHTLTISEIKLTDENFKPITGFEIQNGSIEVVQ